MRKIICILIFSSFYFQLSGQILEVEGKAKVTVMDDDVSTDSLVVLRSGGELARRHISSLPDSTGGWTEVVDTTSTMKRVGIGTASPTHPLNLKVNDQGFSHEALDTNIRLGTYVDGTFGAFFQTHTNHALNFGTNNSLAQMTIVPGGNLGIGTTTPTEKLEVNGNVKVAGIISGVSDPVNAQDAVTKSYIEEILLDFALTTIVDTTKTVQGLLNAGIIPSDIINEGIDSSYFIGLNYAGGLIFYMQGDGTGLVAAPVDQSAGAEWGCFGTSITGADGTAIGTGNQNTIDIEAGCVTPGIAADICVNLNLNGFTDWFLPSKDELNLMWENLADSDGDGSNSGPADPGNLGGFEALIYWSSSEFDEGFAWMQVFFNGFRNGSNKSFNDRVRAIRAF